MREQSHSHINTEVEFFDQIGTYEEASSIEPVRAMDTNDLGRMLPNEIVNYIHEECCDFWRWCFTMTFRIQLTIVYASTNFPFFE